MEEGDVDMARGKTAKVSLTGCKSIREARRRIIGRRRLFLPRRIIHWERLKSVILRIVFAIWRLKQTVMM